MFADKSKILEYRISSDRLGFGAHVLSYEIVSLKWVKATSKRRC